MTSQALARASFTHLILWPQLNNVITGIGTNTLAGGIGINNMLGYTQLGSATVEGNRIVDNRYGIAMIGALNLTVKDNDIINNIYDKNVLTGGEGLSISDGSNKGSAYIEGNHIEGNLWGITVVGAPSVNAGKVSDPASADYNPGHNIFVNNGNGGKLYDLYNNGTGTVYAQGNKWNVALQDSASIEEVIVHKADADSLGLVIFMPPYSPTGINAPVSNGEIISTRYYNLQGQLLREPEKGLVIVKRQYSNGIVESRKVLY